MINVIKATSGEIIGANISTVLLKLGHFYSKAERKT